MTVTRKSVSDYQIERFIAVLSGRWKARIVPALASADCRHSDLRVVLPSVSERALSQALHELAHDGVVVRTDEAWCLSGAGMEMVSALTALYDWGDRYGGGVAPSRFEAAMGEASRGPGALV